MKDLKIRHVLRIYEWLEPKFKDKEDKVKLLEITVNYLKDLEKEFKPH